MNGHGAISKTCGVMNKGYTYHLPRPMMVVAVRKIVALLVSLIVVATVMVRKGDRGA
jgi:hypothetical protein